jgi:hypothetical protein
MEKARREGGWHSDNGDGEEGSGGVEGCRQWHEGSDGAEGVQAVTVAFYVKLLVIGGRHRRGVSKYRGGWGDGRPTVKRDGEAAHRLGQGGVRGAEKKERRRSWRRSDSGDGRQTEGVATFDEG